jgi:adenine-specific DNA-methyltransferase
LRPRGLLVAITPRSFFNGPYFGEFRCYLLDAIALDRVHIFQSRSSVFADTGVLQENVIFSGTRDGVRQTVVLSVSNGHTDDLSSRQVPYVEVVHPADPHRFIRLATDAEDTAIGEVMLKLPCSLRSLGIEVSTGRVVDFRPRAALQVTPTPGAHPLVYPANLRGGGIHWPESIRKAQWFAPTEPKDQAMLLPEGWYTIVKRFSAKEERRRIVAAVWSPVDYPGPVAFENHLNVFHVAGEGLEEGVARRLAIWLNSTLVDRYFRTFSGHTQVNATDLRTFRFPTFLPVTRSATWDGMLMLARTKSTLWSWIGLRRESSRRAGRRRSDRSRKSGDGCGAMQRTIGTGVPRAAQSRPGDGME